MSNENKERPFEFDNSFVLLKYFNVFIMKTPFSNFSNYSHGLNKIFEELAKT